MSRLISFAVLLAFIAVIGALFYKVMIGFLVPIFLAAVLVVVFRPLHRYILSRTGEHATIASAITTILILLTVLVPAIALISAAAVQGTNLLRANLKEARVEEALSKFRKALNLEMENADLLRSIDSEIESLQQFVVAENENRNTLTSGSGNLLSLSKRLNRDVSTLQTLVEDSASVNGDHRRTESIQIREASKEPFEQFAISLAKLDAVKDQVVEGGEEIDQIEIQSRALDVANGWRRLKEALLGGSTRAFLRELANPGKGEIKSITESVVDVIRPRLVSFTTTTGGVLAKLLIGFAILSISLFFFLQDGPSMVRGLMQLSPLDDRYERKLLEEFDRTARAVVLAMILSAIVQGLIAGVGYYFGGVPSSSLVFLVFLTMLCALIPFVGPSLVWIPVCAYLALYNENYWAAAGLALWGVLVVGTSDNIVKALVLHGQSQLHPFLALLSVLGGVQSLGPVGILVGPMAVSMLQTLLGILQHELVHFDFEMSNASGSSPSTPSGRMTALAKLARRFEKLRNNSVETTSTSSETNESSSISPPAANSELP